MFSIRALSMMEGLPPNARTSVGTVLGTEVEFRSGVAMRLTLPSDAAAFANLPEPDSVLAALAGWARVYSFPENKGRMVHILAPAEQENGDVNFYRLDLWQRQKLRGPRPAVEVVGGATMDYDQCAEWLVDLAHRRAVNADSFQRFQCISRPQMPLQPDIRLAWIGPPIVGGQVMAERLAAIGEVYDAVVPHVAPISFAHVHAQLGKLAPLHSAIICSHFAPYITGDAVPDCVSRDLIHVCGSSQRGELEQQVRTWLDITAPTIRAGKESGLAEEQNAVLLKVMLQGMLSHSKIGANNHCPKETVLKRIRALHLNAASAEQILDANSEKHESTKDSDSLFLWKDHNDGDQYFLNPKQVMQIKAMLTSMQVVGSSTGA